MQRRDKTYRDVDQLDPERVADQIICEDSSTLQASIGPSLPVRVGNVQLCDRDGVDLVGRLGHRSFDSLLVVVGEDCRHIWLARLGYVYKGQVTDWLYVL